MGVAAARSSLYGSAEELTAFVERPVGMKEMLSVIDGEAARIEQSERNWAEVADPQRPAPLPDQLRRAFVLRRVAWILEFVAGDQKLIERLKAAAAKAR